MTENIDRSGLIDALIEFTKVEEKREFFTWCGNVDAWSSTGIQALYIAGIGLVEYPVSSKGINAIKAKCEANSNVIEACDITVIPNKHTSSTLENLIVRALEETLNIELEHINVGIEAKLEKLVLCEDENSYKAALDNRKEPGRVGTFSLQVPVENEQSAANLIFQDGAKATQMLTKGEVQCFAALFTGGKSSCGKRDFVIQSSRGKTTLALVYHLIWNDYLKLKIPLFSTDCFGQFLVQTYKVSKLLSMWDFSKQEPPEDSEIARYICLPLNTNKGVPQGQLSLTMLDELMEARSLASIEFIDVNYVMLSADRYYFSGEETSLNAEQQITDNSSLTQSLTITGRLFGGGCLQDGFFDSLANWKEHLIGKFRFHAEASTQSYYLYCPAVVIRPRHPKRVIPGTKSTVEILLSFLESELANMPGKKDSEKVALQASLSQLLEETVKATRNVLSTDQLKHRCKFCLFTSLLRACVRLGAVNPGLEVLDLMLDTESQQWLSCICPPAPSPLRSTKLLSTLSDFFVFNNGLHTSEKFSHLVGKLLKEEEFGQIFDLGMNLFLTDNLIGAHYVFDHISTVLEAPVPNNRTSKFEDHFTADWVNLAIHLFEKDTDSNHGTLSKFFESLLTKELGASQLTETVEYLFETLTSERVNCRFSLQEFGRLIAREKSFRKFEPEDFLKIIRVYSALNDDEVLTTLWNAVCSDCIHFSETAKETRYLFCQMLLMSHPNANEVFAPPATVPEIREALKCSMQIAFSTDENVLDCESIAHFLKNAAIFKDIFGVDAQITKKFSEVIVQQNSHRLCELLHTVFKRSFEVNLFEKYPTLNETFEIMLNDVIYVRDKTELASSKSLTDDLTKAFAAVAWCRKQEDVEAMLVNVDDVANRANASSSLRVSIISSALLTPYDNGKGAASSLKFNRDIFNFLLLEWLKYPSHSITSLFTIFQLFTEAEKNFIDSAPESVTTELAAQLGELAFRETVKFVGDVFIAEMNDDGPSLKKFPACWQIYTQMCLQVLSKMILCELHQLPVKEIVSLVQGFLWVRHKESIEQLARLVCTIPSKGHMADVHEEIINDKKTEELATCSTSGIMALNDIFDVRIQQLNMSFAYQLTKDNLSKVGYGGYRSTPALPYIHTGEPPPPREGTDPHSSEIIERNMEVLENCRSQSRGIPFSACLGKIAVLQALRRKLLSALSKEK